jgi:antitoxin component of MazEF toxin-antitoxin module
VIKRLQKVGNSNAVILDKAVMELAGLDDGGSVQISVRDGSVIITPARPRHVDEKRFEKALARVTSRRKAALKRLAE